MHFVNICWTVHTSNRIVVVIRNSVDNGPQVSALASELVSSNCIVGSYNTK